MSGVNVGLPTVKLRRSPHGLRCFVSVSSSRPIGGGRCSLPMLAARPRWCAASQENRSVRFRERRLDVSARSARKLCGAKRCSEQCAFARSRLQWLLWPEPRRAEDLRLACAETSLHRAEPHASYIHIRRRECMPRVRTRVARVTTHSVGTGRRRVCERCTQALSADVCRWCWLRPRRCATALRTRLSRCMCVLSFSQCVQHSTRVRRVCATLGLCGGVSKCSWVGFSPRRLMSRIRFVQRPPRDTDDSVATRERESARARCVTAVCVSRESQIPWDRERETRRESGETRPARKKRARA